MTERSALVGREPQLTAMRDALARVSTHSAAEVIILHGPPGAGTSAVEAAALAERDDLEVVSIPGLPWEASVPLAGVRRLLRALGADRHQEVTADALADLLQEHQRRSARTLVIRVEEAQHCDARTLMLLSSAVHRLTSTPVLVILVIAHATVGAYLDPLRASAIAGVVHDLVSVHHRALVSVGPLSIDEVAELALSEGHALTPEAVTRLHHHTGGIVRDVLDVLHEVPDEAWITPGTTLPPTRAATVSLASRLHGARRDVVRILEVASVLPDGVAIDIVGQVAGVSDVVPAIDELVRLGLLVTRSYPGLVRVSFASPLLRAATYDAMTLTQRRGLHRRACHIVRDPGERLRQRALASHGLDDDLARELSSYAAQAAAEGSWSFAAEALEAAVTLALPGPTREDLLIRALDAVTGAGDIPRAEQLVPEVSSLPESPARDAAMAYVSANGGRRDETTHLLTRAWAAVDAHADPTTAARICQRHVLHSLLDWDCAGVVSWARETRRHGPPDSSAVVESRVIVGLGLGGLGKTRQAVAAYDDTADVVGGAQEQRAMMGHGWLDLALDNVRKAAWRLQLATPTEFHRGSRRVSLWSLGWLARARLMLGDLEGALQAVTVAAPMVDSSGLTMLSALIHWTGAEARAVRGQWDAAEGHVARATSGPQEYATTVVPACLARAHLARARGDQQGVLRACEPLLELRRHRPIDEPGFWPWQDLYADALVNTRNLSEADDFLTPLERTAAARRHHSTIARLAASRGRLLAAQGEIDAAEESFRSATAAARAVDAPYLVATTSFAHGLALRHAGRRRDAAERLREAGHLFERFGASVYADQCSRELRTAAATARPSRVHDTGLTSQEDAVAKLVAQGRRNREIASDLYLSAKTVEYHLTRIYGKVGVSSRGELAAWYRSKSG